MADALNLYRTTPRVTRGNILDCLWAGLVPFVQSSPGVGKSSLMRSICEELNLEMIDVRLSTAEPTDLTGLPNFVNGKARYAPFEEIFPLEGTPLPPGKDGWMIFLDEMNAAPKPTQAASYKLILDRMVGQHKLHPNVVVAAAGNFSTDRAIVNTMSTAMQSRLIHLEMEVCPKEHMEDVMLKEGYDSRIMAFLAMYPEALMDFRPDHAEKTFCCPRTWEFMQRLVKGKPIVDGKTALYAGTITSGVAVRFTQFVQVYKSMVTVAQIRANPTTCPVPTDKSTCWALICHMMEHTDATNFPDLATYANRFGMDFRILFYRSVMVRHPKLLKHPDFIEARVALSRYLND